MPGFPKYPEKNNLIDSLCSLGFNVLVPLYSGSHESAGSFSINNSVDDVFDWYDYLLKGELCMGNNSQAKVIDTNTISIISSSYGSLITDLAFRKYSFKKLHKTIFTSPLYKAHLFKTEESLKIADTISDFIKNKHPEYYRFNNKVELFEIIKGEKIIKLEESIIKTKLEHVLIVNGSEDQITPPEMAEELAKSYATSELHIIDGGHSSKINSKKLNSLIKKFL